MAQDRNYGVQDMGGSPIASFLCPIFDTTDDMGSFRMAPSAKLTLTYNPPRPPEISAYKEPGYVRVVDIFSLAQYSVAENFRFDKESLDVRNWLRLIEHSGALRTGGSSVMGFIQSVTTLVRLEDNPNRQPDPRKFMIKVSSRAFGTIVPFESTGIPVLPIGRAKDTIQAAKRNYRRVLSLKPDFEERT
jgi:hypothetical protein